MRNRRLAQREARLDRINKQLSEPYGPLLADLEAGHAAWAVFQEARRTSGPTLGPEAMPSEKQAALWRRWIQTVFQPTNRRMIDRVKTHADLLLEDSMPTCLSALAANTAAYDVLAAQWQEQRERGPSRREDLFAPDEYAFPRAELAGYIPVSFRALKEAQAELLGTLGRTAAHGP